MVLDSSDLQQRRMATPASTPMKVVRRKLSGSGSSIKRRKRTSDASGAAILAATGFAAIFLPLGFLVSRLTRTNNSGSSEGANDPSTLRFLKVWKPKLSSSSSAAIAALNDADVDAALEERVQQREARYRSLYRLKFDESTLGYDIYNCPPTPPHDYPMAWPVTDVLTNWNPNDVTTLPPNYRSIYQGLCVFDYETQYETALAYRNAEKPFVIRNDPKVMKTARKWDDDPEYLHRVLGDVEEFRTERSPNNYFMWYRLRGKKSTPKGYEKPPNDEIEMTFGEWLEHALEKDGKAVGSEDLLSRARELEERRTGRISKRGGGNEPEEDDEQNDGSSNSDSEEAKDKKWYYFRLNVDLKGARKGSPDSFIYDELSFFDPRKRKDSEFYIVEPQEERGINCRFGMRGVIAANHFDLSRNMIAIFGGERRYILAHPNQCKNMALYPRGHPSLRHSSIDWTNPNEWDHDPHFRDARVNEVVMHAGDVLYLPTAWFHYIVNLGLNYQCNARSGITYENEPYLDECGFPS